MPSEATTLNLIDRAPAKGLSLPFATPGSLKARWLWDSSGGALRGLLHFTGDEDLYSVGADGANLADGIKILTLPAGAWTPIRGRSYLTIKDSSTGAFAAGEIGVGTVQASGAVAVLGGTGTFKDWMVGQAIAPIPTVTPTLQNLVGDATAGLTNVLSGSLDLYLNMAATFSAIGSAHKAVIASGSQLEIWFHGIGATPAKA